jgi:hypothetical protein
MTESHELDDLDHLDPQLATVECRLQRHPAPAAAPLLRHRVLMAVDDVLLARPHASLPDPSATIAGWAWAVAAAVAVLLTWPMTTLPGTSLVTASDGLRLAARLQAAGVPAEDLVTAVTPTEIRTDSRKDLVNPAARSVPTDPFARRGLDARRLLQELL